MRNPSKFLFLSLLLFLPSQLGKHFWPPFSFINGLRIDYLSPTIYFTDIIILLLFLEMLPVLLRTIKIRVLIPVAIALLYLSVLSLYSQWPVSSLLGVVRVGEVVIVSWFISRFIGRENMSKHTITVLSISLIVVSILAIWQYFSQHSVGGFWYLLGERSFSIATPGIANANLSGSLILRPYATFPHPNVLGGFCVLMVCYLLYFSRWQVGQLERMLLVTAVFGGAITTTLSMSRSAIVVLTAVIAVWLLCRIGKSAKNIVLTLLFGIGGGGLLLASGALVRFSSLRITDEAVILRELLTIQGLQIINNNFWTGVGVLNYLPTLALTLDPLLPYRNLQPVHSIYLLIMSEAGIVGLFVFILGVLFCIQKTWKSKGYRLGKYMLLLAALLLGITDHYFYTLHQGQLLLGFVFGVLIAVYPASYFTDSKAKNRGTSIQRLSSKKTMPSVSLKISRTRVSRRKIA